MDTWRAVILMGMCAFGIVAGASADDAAVADNDATLKSIVPTTGKISPDFSSSRKSYVLHLPGNIDTLGLSPTPANPRASVTIENGDPKAPLMLSPGRNMVHIGVTSADGATKSEYVLKVFRALPTPDWTQVQPRAPWSPRDSAGELVFNDALWIFGGYTPGLVSDVWRSTDGASWTEVGRIPNDVGVNIPIQFVHDGRMWLATNDGKLYSSNDGAAWDLVTDAAPWAGRYAAGSAVFNGRMWVLGGMKKGGTLYNDVWSSADGVHWDLETANAPWAKRQLFSMVAVLDGKMWVVGGGVTIYHPFKAYTDVWCSTDGRAWTCVTDHAPWPARIWSTVAVYRNRLWLLGGFHAEPDWSNLSDAWYSTDGAHWKQLKTDSFWSPRHELSAYVFQDKLWAAGGNAWPLMNDVWQLDLKGLAFITRPDVETLVTTRYEYRAEADFHASRSPLHYRLVEAPSWLTVDATTGVVSGTPEAVGDFNVTVEATDEAGETARQTFTLHVVPLS